MSGSLNLLPLPQHLEAKKTTNDAAFQGSPYQQHRKLRLARELPLSNLRP